MPFFSSYETLSKELPSSLNSFLFVGKDEESKSPHITLLIDHLLLKEGAKESALTSFEAGRCEESALIASLSSFSLLSKKSLILVRHAEKLSKECQEALALEVKRLPSSFALILIASSLLKQSSLWKAIESKGAILDYPELKPWEKEKKIKEWVYEEAARQGGSIKPDAAEVLVKYSKNDRLLLSKELEKLFTYISERKDILLQDVRAICVRSFDESVWKLGEAIFSRKASHACLIAKALLEEGESLFVLLRQLRSQFQTYYEVSLMLERNKTPGEITDVFPFIKGQLLERYTSLARSYQTEGFRRGILAIDETERKAKNGDFDESLLIDLLMIKLTKKL